MSRPASATPPEVSRHAVDRVLRWVMPRATRDEAHQWILEAWATALPIDRHRHGPTGELRGRYAVLDGRYLFVVAFEGARPAAVVTVVPGLDPEAETEGVRHGRLYTEADVDRVKQQVRLAKQGAHEIVERAKTTAERARAAAEALHDAPDLRDALRSQARDLQARQRELLWMIATGPEAEAARDRVWARESGALLEAIRREAMRRALAERVAKHDAWSLLRACLAHVPEELAARIRAATDGEEDWGEDPEEEEPQG